MSNKSNGSAVEQYVCDKLSECGFWAHNAAQGRAGQPADIIAVKGNKAYLIDCKDCRTGRFDKRRIEPNQYTAMELWRQCGNGDGWFAVNFETETYMVSLLGLESENRSSLREAWFATNCSTLDQWLKGV